MIVVATASEITRKAKSNLAFALQLLPKDRRADATTFYAFCRTIDDLADDPTAPLASRRTALEAWKNGLCHGFSDPTGLPAELCALRDRLQLPNDLLTAIIDGCLMDLEPRRFATRDELRSYIWKVACAVGLVSIRVFGCTDPASERYAEQLGEALQLTNILRDVGEDLANGGRIYLPLEDLARHGYSEPDLREKTHDARFVALMGDLADAADRLFAEAAQTLPAADRTALAPARAMAEIYQAILAKMRADRFRVFDRRYRLSMPRKLAILSKHLIA